MPQTPVEDVQLERVIEIISCKWFQAGITEVPTNPEGGTALKCRGAPISRDTPRRLNLDGSLVSRQLPSFQGYNNRDRGPIRQGQRLLYHAQLLGIIIEHDRQDDRAS